MAKKRKINPLLKASVFYILGNGIGQGAVLLSSIVFTRIMTQNDYGIYSTYYSLVSILTTLVGANLFNALNNGYIEYKKVIHKFRASVLLLSSVVFIVVVTITLLVNSVIRFEESFFMLNFALIHAYAFFVVNYFNNSANMENKYQIKTVFLILPNVLQVSFSLVLMYIMSGVKLNARIIGSTLGVFVCAVYVYVKMMWGEKRLFQFEYWKYALKISVPSILSSISYMLMQQCDKIMITYFYSAVETAVYSLVYNIGYVLYAALQATTGVWQAWIYKALDKGNIENVKKVQKWYLFVFGQMGYGLLMISPEVVKLLAPSSYWNFAYISPFILGSSLMVMYTFYTTIGLFYKKSGKVSACVLTAALINVILNYLLIPVFGGVAAAYTSAIAYLVLFILSRLLCQKLNRGLLSGKYFVLYLAIIVVGCGIFSVIHENIMLRYIVYTVFLICSLIYMYKSREELIDLIKNN